MVGFIVGFSSVWQLTLLTLAIVPLMVIAGGIHTVTMSGLSKKGEAAYAEAGKIADEVDEYMQNEILHFEKFYMDINTRDT